MISMISVVVVMIPITVFEVVPIAVFEVVPVLEVVPVMVLNVVPVGEVIPVVVIPVQEIHHPTKRALLHQLTMRVSFYSIPLLVKQK